MKQAFSLEVGYQQLVPSGIFIGICFSLFYSTHRGCASCVIPRLRRFWRSRAASHLTAYVFGNAGEETSTATAPSPDLEAEACLWILQPHRPTEYGIDGTKLFAPSGSFKISIAHMLKQSSNSTTDIPDSSQSWLPSHSWVSLSQEDFFF